MEGRKLGRWELVLMKGVSPGTVLLRETETYCRDREWRSGRYTDIRDVEHLLYYAKCDSDGDWTCMFSIHRYLCSEDWRVGGFNVGVCIEDSQSSRAFHGISKCSMLC